MCRRRHVRTRRRPELARRCALFTRLPRPCSIAATATLTVTRPPLASQVLEVKAELREAKAVAERMAEQLKKAERDVADAKRAAKERADRASLAAAAGARAEEVAKASTAAAADAKERCKELMKKSKESDRQLADTSARLATVQV